MEWYEYLIIVAAVGLVVLPIVNHFRDKKRGICSCGEKCSGNCGHCGHTDNCSKNPLKEAYDKAYSNKD